MSNKIVDKLIGIGLMIAGIAIWSINYFVVKALSSIGMWFAGCFACLGILLLVIFLGGCVFWIGFDFFK